MSKCPFSNQSKDFSEYKGNTLKMIDALPAEVDKQSLDIITATAPAVVANLEKITSTFYPKMFCTHPSTKNYFNTAHQVVKDAEGKTVGGQPFALARAVVRYVGHLNDPVGLRAAIELAAQKHCALGVRAEHYPIVHECLMWAVGEVLGAAVTQEVADAWSKAVLYLARAFIERELEIYASQLTKEWGWFGWRKFVVSEKHRESDAVYTYVFKPLDDGAIPAYNAGQYITLRFHNVPGTDAEFTQRHYSLNHPHNTKQNTFSISVKIERGTEGGKPGVVSNYMRDSLHVGSEVNIGMPYGTLNLDAVSLTEGGPVVLVSGGIGVTPIAAILAHVLANSQSKVYSATVVRNGSQHPYRSRFARFANDHSERLVSRVYYSQPRNDWDKQGIDYDVQGRLAYSDLKAWVGEEFSRAKFVVCGPDAMVESLMVGLTDDGIPRSSIQFECFGPLAAGLDKFAVQ